MLMSHVKLFFTYSLTFLSCSLAIVTVICLIIKSFKFLWVNSNISFSFAMSNRLVLVELLLDRRFNFIRLVTLKFCFLSI